MEKAQQPFYLITFANEEVVAVEDKNTETKRVTRMA